MKYAIVLLAETLTCILGLFFTLNGVLTPWGFPWKIVCIALACVFLAGFVACFILSRTKFKETTDEVKEEAAPAEETAPSEEAQENA
ncbi:MAG: hypothetical protein MJ068_02300 [Clostridia bacterium]|nr:hypothetical protein [Clostridia bacterium]